MGPNIKACTHWDLWTPPGSMDLICLKRSPGTSGVEHETARLAAAAREAQLSGLARGPAIKGGGVAIPHLTPVGEKAPGESA